jgi:uncharacterized protein with GYD domain
MLFIFDHHHAAEACPAGTVHPDKNFANSLNKAAKETGVKLVEGFVDGPGHHIYLVVEADDNAQLYNFAAPLMNVGVTRVAPVMKWSSAIDAARKGGRQK